MLARLFCAVFLLGSLLPRGTAAAEEACHADWSIAAPIVKREGLISVEALSAELSRRVPGNLVKATLCERSGSFAFHIVVRGSNGQLKSLVLDAKKPFGP